VRPLVLAPNQQPRFYRGGERIAALRGLPLGEEKAPEDWVGATNAAFGSNGAGPSRLPDGRLLRDAVRADPEAFLGGEHLGRFGPDPVLLVKLLDAGERLPVHFHPGRDFARRVLGAAHGKTEAWVILHAEPGAVVHLGFRSHLRPATVREWVERQDGEAMLAALRRVPVTKGDVLLVPAGTPHAIGEGILLVELQEPTDYSVLMETEPFGLTGDPSVHLGLGWDRALEALDLSGWDDERLGTARGRPRPIEGRAGAVALLPRDADPYFRAERIEPRRTAEMDAGFSILVVLEGEGGLTAKDDVELPLSRGETLLVPYAAGGCRLTGELEAVRCRPPDPAAGEGDW
jgi:mannose-6-phosphate isomerase